MASKDWYSQTMKRLDHQVYSSPRVIRRKVQKEIKKSGIQLSSRELHLIAEDIISSRKRGEMGRMYNFNIKKI